MKGRDHYRGDAEREEKEGFGRDTQNDGGRRGKGEREWDEYRRKGEGETRE